MTTWGIDAKDGKGRMHVDGFPRLEVHNTGEVRAFPFTAVDRLVRAGEAFGVGQTLQDVFSSRVSTTVYTNLTGKPIVVYVFATSNTMYGVLTGYVDGVTYAASERNMGGIGVSFIVPPGSTYMVSYAGATISGWKEYR